MQQRQRQTMIYCSINLLVAPLLEFTVIFFMFNLHFDQHFIIFDGNKIIIHIRKLKRKEQNKWRIPTAIGKQTK